MVKKRVIVTGAGGFIGRHLWPTLAAQHDVVPTFYPQAVSGRPAGLNYLDVTDASAVRAVVERHRPQYIIHLAGNKDLSYCNRHPDYAYNVNYAATQHVVDAAVAVGARCVFISSDYVFEGTRGNYRETDATAPTTVYGETKALSEAYVKQAGAEHSILRTSAVYGQGAGFMTWVVGSLLAGTPIEAFADTFFTPTYIDDVVAAFARIVAADLAGTLHVAGPTVTSRYEMARQIADYLAVDPELVRASTVAGSGLLIVPNSALNCDRSAVRLNMSFLSLSQGLERFFRANLVAPGSPLGAGRREVI